LGGKEAALSVAEGQRGAKAHAYHRISGHAAR